MEDTVSKAKTSVMAGSRTLKEVLRRDLKDPEFRKAFEAHCLEATVAERIYQLREKRHLTQKELASKAGMAQNSVSRIEKGENSLTLRTVQRVAAALGYSVAVEFRPM